MQFDTRKTRIWLDALVGVILTVIPVISIKVVDALENVSVLVVLTTCNTLPADACNADDDPATTG